MYNGFDSNGQEHGMAVSCDDDWANTIHRVTAPALRRRFACPDVAILSSIEAGSSEGQLA